MQGLAQLNREEIEVAAARGAPQREWAAWAMRGKKCKTTYRAKSADRPADLVKRIFSASRPNQLGG